MTSTATLSAASSAKAASTTSCSASVPISSSSSYSSAKQLWQLVTEQSLVASDQVIQTELDRHKDILAKGITWFGRRKRDATTSTLTTATKRAPGKLTRFLAKLGDLLGVDDDAKAKGILYAYLAGDFRGTKQSLKRLVDDDRLQKPLMVDIWQFYRAERLHLLQVLKELLTHSGNASHRHHSQFVDTLKALDKESAGLGQSLLTQLEWVMAESPPNREGAFTENCLWSWAHFNLREQSELLQLNLLFLHSGIADTDTTIKTFKKYFLLFQEHAFGHKLESSHVVADVNSDLIESIGLLESLLLVYLIDLPSVSVRSPNHAMSETDSADPDMVKVERMVAGLGSQPEHGPVMLAWMLAKYMLSDEDRSILSKYHAMGERAVQLRALNVLTRAATNSVLSSHSNLHSVVRGICYALLAVLSTSFDLQQMGLTSDGLTLTLDLLQSPPIASDFWRQGLDVGLGTMFASLLSCFPFEMRNFASFGQSLCKAGPESAERMLSCLEAMPVYTELIGEVDPTSVSKSTTPDGEERWHLRMARRFRQDSEVFAPAGTTGIVHGQFVRWHCRFSAFRYFLGDMEALAQQLSLGTQSVRQDTLSNVIEVISLLEILMRNNQEPIIPLENMLMGPILLLVDRASHLAQPSLKLLANSIKLLTVMAKRSPVEIWTKLAETGLLPHFSSHTRLGSDAANEADLNPGIVGALLAQQECGNGEYPLTTAFFDLTLACVARKVPAAASLSYIARNIFPCYRQWRFESAADRERFGQKMLALFNRFLKEDSDSSMKDLLCVALVQPGPLQTILSLIGTGDRAIRSLLEAQSSWEAGVGVELSRLVNLSMTVFERLLILAADVPSLSPRIEDISHLLCSLPVASGQQLKPHFLLTLAHYVYHSQSYELPVSAMRLLGTVARMFPMSLLACLGGDAEAIRDVLIYRLESQTEDVSLKVAIINLFSACVDSQPGFIQLLIGIQQDVHVVGAAKPLTAEEKDKNASVKLVSEQGCLRLILELLSTVTKTENSSMLKKLEGLHLSLVNFILNLWQHQRILAMSYLKRQPDFWNRLTWSVFNPKGQDRLNINAKIFRIMANEIYTYKGEVDKELFAALERLCDEKDDLVVKWNERILSKVRASVAMEEESPKAVTKEEGNLSLLNAWKAFLTVFSKDQPVAISPLQCHEVASELLSAIEDHMLAQSSNEGNPEPRAATSLAEFCLVLMRRWQTKCAGADMSLWIDRVGGFLRSLAAPPCPWESLPARCRVAAVGIAATALRASSHFKLDNETDALCDWIDSVTVIVQRAFRMEVVNEEEEDYLQENQFAIVAVDLLTMLIHRIKEPADWFPPLHQHVLIQTLLAKLNEAMIAERQPELCQSILGLLCLVAKCPRGFDALLTSNLSHLVWMPLSDVGKRRGFPGSSGAQWARVFRLSLNLASLLQSQGGRLSLQNTLDVLVLLQDRLTSFVALPRALLNGTDEARLMVESISIAANFMKYFKEWHLLHSTSLTSYYQLLTTNLYYATCLLLRPSTLTQMITKSNAPTSTAAISSKEDRVRRLSSTDQELEAAHQAGSSSIPEVTVAQVALLESAASVLGALLELSPKLEDLVAGDVSDPKEFQQLLGIGFSSPSFEQDSTVTYGTLTSLCNFCIRALSKMGGSSGGLSSVSEAGNRTPSPITPSKSPGPPPIGLLSSSPAPATTATSRLGVPSTTSAPSVTGSTSGVTGIDKRRLVTVLERAMSLMLAQSLLFFSDPSYSTRDKQFLRRELGAEFNSFSESIRRYITGGSHHRIRLDSTPSPQGGIGGGARSPGGASQASSYRTNSEEQFIKLVNALVQNVFK